MMKTSPIRVRRDGFTLIATLLLTSLLAVIATGLLSLSLVDLRTGQSGEAVAEAQSNARLALELALGELQESMGPDQRISANSSILTPAEESGSASGNRHWTGVWNSWKAEKVVRGSPRPLDGGSDHRTIPGTTGDGMHPTYVPNRKDHFRSWLVSLTEDEVVEIASPFDVALDGETLPGKGAEAVRLVGEGTLGKESAAEEFVNARLLELGTGRYAWWVGDESQKARIMDDPYGMPGADPTLAEKVFRHQAPGSTGTAAAEGLGNVTDETQLAALPTLQTLDLVDGVEGAPSEGFHHVSAHSFQVMADVREGGLKRDLTTLLERPISVDETGDPFMLYRFDTAGEARVPIQDLAAFYQLYDGARPGWKEGVEYSSTLVPGRLQLSAPDFGNRLDTDKFLRGYTTLYRRPVPVKVQFLLSMTAEAINPPPIPTRSNPNPDTHRLVLGITPSVTLWNPSNLPIVMNYGDPLHDAVMLRLSNLPFFIKWNKNNGEYISSAVNLTWAAQSGGTSGGAGGKSNIFSLYFSGENQIKLEPGEVKVFSLPYRPGVFSFNKWDRFTPPHEVAAGWDPTSYLLMRNSAPGGDSENISNKRLTFKAEDQIAFTVHPETANGIESLSRGNELPGSGLQFFMIQTSHQNRSGTGGLWHFRDYQFTSRFGSGGNTVPFNAALISKGFPGGAGPITSASRSGANIIAAAQNDEAWPFLQFALMAGTETGEASNGGSFAGRKFTSRPFLHSTSISPPFIDGHDGNSLYNYGWNWWVEDINSVLEANVQVSPENRGYYGGGYTPESGTTHVIQQEVPVVPPMSIASLSSAHLGGFSIASESPVGFGDGIADSSGYYGLVRAYEDRYSSFQKVSATGHAGLFPHSLQAIGNSYAHPIIPADKAYTIVSRHFNQNANAKDKTFADHSYLANKALWDDYFFSSIAPFPETGQLYEDAAGRSAKDVARGFFFGDEPLPNRRFVPYSRNLDEGTLDFLFTQADDYEGGLADKIAAHLLAEGPFNVNSTSVEAWKVLLSSLKGKKVAYLDLESSLSGGRGKELIEDAEVDGTPVSSFSLPAGAPAPGGTSDPSDPEQWTSWRQLTDVEIEKLAVAIVEQVKLRGPFLSLSEFVNRRLDASNKELSVKGALQAALDDEDVPINAGFRNPVRKFSDAEIAQVNPAFPEALEGPVAYGSAAYVDQADILRNFAGQLTPRGDTFVIRTYGDSLDRGGNVVARAWCEAVVQRVPEYVDPVDDPHLKTGDLSSPANKAFGRQFRIVSFRWLSPSEI